MSPRQSVRRTRKPAGSGWLVRNRWQTRSARESMTFQSPRTFDAVARSPPKVMTLPSVDRAPAEAPNTAFAGPPPPGADSSSHLVLLVVLTTTSPRRTTVVVVVQSFSGAGAAADDCAAAGDAARTAAPNAARMMVRIASPLPDVS